MNVLIVDDEALARDRLQRMLEEMGGYTVHASIGNGREALEACQNGQVDIVLLDIRMPVMDGMEAARYIARLPNPPAVIFTTAYGEHALQAFDAQAIDYLLKPIRSERLKQALERAHRLSPAQTEVLLGESGQRRTHVSTSFHGKVLLIPINTIHYFQAADKYVTAYHQDGEALLDESLKSLEDDLTDSFIRVHRNALVSRQALIGMEKDTSGTYHATLRDCAEQPEISRRHVTDVRKALKERG